MIQMLLSYLTICSMLKVTWLETDLFTLGLGFLMLSMGLTLTFEDFRRCLRNPWTVSQNIHTWVGRLLVKQINALVLVFTLLMVLIFNFAGRCRFSCSIPNQAYARICYCNGNSYFAFAAILTAGWVKLYVAMILYFSWIPHV